MFVKKQTSFEKYKEILSKLEEKKDKLSKIDDKESLRELKVLNKLISRTKEQIKKHK
ncbi:MAG: hypothetical protein U9R16_02200 [Campylobacterota bacterium]|nr:hypothetical protein [Campylobacterota bacterium]